MSGKLIVTLATPCRSQRVCVWDRSFETTSLPFNKAAALWLLGGQAARMVPYVGG